MKRIIRHRSGKWLGFIFADTEDPLPPHDVAPAPNPPHSPEPPVYTEIGRAMAFNI